MATQFSGSTAANDVAQLNASAESITVRTAFTDGFGGYHCDVSDAVLNSSYPRVAGGNRQYVWQNLQQLQTDLTAANTALAAQATDLADIKAALAQLTASPTDPTNVVVADVRYAVANP